jgi:hypothetical protein
VINPVRSRECPISRFERSRFAAGFFPGEAVADEVLLLGFDVEAEFFFDIVVAAWRDGLPELANYGEEVCVIHSAMLRRVGRR